MFTGLWFLVPFPFPGPDSIRHTIHINVRCTHKFRTCIIIPKAFGVSHIHTDRDISVPSYYQRNRALLVLRTDIHHVFTQTPNTPLHRPTTPRRRSRQHAPNKGRAQAEDHTTLSSGLKNSSPTCPSQRRPIWTRSITPARHPS